MWGGRLYAYLVRASTTNHVRGKSRSTPWLWYSEHRKSFCARGIFGGNNNSNLNWNRNRKKLGQKRVRNRKFSGILRNSARNSQPRPNEECNIPPVLASIQSRIISWKYDIEKQFFSPSVQQWRENVGVRGGTVTWPGVDASRRASKVPAAALAMVTARAMLKMVIKFSHQWIELYMY